jgi:hypothetical protein
LLERFDWDEIDPEEWVILAKKSGMKYVTITAKHHDGFGLWNSQVSDYDLGNYTNPKRDIVKNFPRLAKNTGSNWDCTIRTGLTGNMNSAGIIPKKLPELHLKNMTSTGRKK